MTLTRRSMLAFSAGAAATALLGVPAYASADDVKAKIAEFTGGGEAKAEKLALTAPEIAENGNTVPVSVSVESPMSDDDFVETVTIYADGNPSPEVVSFHFTPMSGKAEATTRIRLAKTQNVVSVAKTSKGEFYTASAEVKVTIGGCGG